MSRKYFKNGNGEIQYIIFFFVFIGIMSIIGNIFLKEVIVKELSTNDDFLKQIMNGVSNFVKDIPLFNTFWNYVIIGYGFAYIHPYLALIYGVLIGMPFAYVILRLIRGGG